MSTMREVAERAGVSAKTVSRVINHNRHISADVRSRVGPLSPSWPTCRTR